MKRQLIYFNEKQYKEEVKNLESIIEVINKYSHTLNITIDRELLYLISDISKLKKFKETYYLNELKKVCEFFGVNFDEVKTFEYSLKNPLFKEMAINKCRLLFQFIDEVRKYMYRNSYLISYIDIYENIANKTLNCDENLKEYFKTYTSNDKENIVYNKLKELQTIYKELNNIVSRKEIESILNYDNSINVTKFKQVLK